jgi:hypothetical protein
MLIVCELDGAEFRTAKPYSSNDLILTQHLLKPGGKTTVYQFTDHFLGDHYQFALTIQ